MNTLKGYDAIEYAELHDLRLSMYNSPIEDAREGLTVDEAREIAREDAGLIYLEVEDRYYLIRHERVVNSTGADTYYEIQTAPGRTNLGNKVLVDGWLGQTNDWSQYAEGEFDTLDDARAAIPDGFRESDDDLDDDVAAKYVMEVEAWSPGDYLEAWEPSAEDRAMPLDQLVSALIEDAASHAVLLDERALRAYLASRYDMEA